MPGSLSAISRAALIQSLSYLQCSFRKFMVYEAAQSMLRSKKWSWLKAWAMQVRRCRMKKAIVALARRALQELAGLPKIIT
jgi:hypothetical protein